MTWLALDTAGPVCAAALIGDGPDSLCLAERSAGIGRGHAECLPTQITEILVEADRTHADLSGIAVVAGPGSFTGVRIGVAMARGLALALDIPAFGIDGLEALIANAQPGGQISGRTGNTGTLIAAVLDANRGELFARAAFFDSGETPVLPSAAYAPPDLVAALVGASRDGKICLTGSGAALIADDLTAAGADVSLATPTETGNLSCLVALARAGRGVRPPVPLYLRAPDAKPQAGKAVPRRDLQQAGTP